MLAIHSSGSLEFFLKLHGGQQTTKLSIACLPPRHMGTTWSNPVGHVGLGLNVFTAASQ